MGVQDGRQTRARIQEIADGEIEPDADELLRHLRACERCGAELEQIKELKHAIARVIRDRGGALQLKLEAAVRELQAGGG